MRTRGETMLDDVATLFREPIVLSQPADRRASRRFVDVWTRAARGRFPDWASIRACDLAEDWNWVYAVDLQKSAGFPYFIFLGAHLARLSDVYLAGDADFTLSLLDTATSEIETCVAEQCPHIREDELTLYNGRRILFRSVAAPLAEDGETISHVAGIVTGTFAP